MSVRNQLGLSATIDRLSVARRVPTPLVHAALAPYTRTGYLRRRGLDAKRLIETLSLPVDPLSGAEGDLPAIDVVIPCGPGDAEMLPRVMESAPSGASNPIRRIQVVAPPSVITTLRPAVDSNTDLIDENDLLGAAVVASIGKRFPSRRNWVLQQVVKVACVTSSQAPGVLILDADTILLRQRTWLTSDGRQVLTPTIEWHQPYYDFLGRLSNEQWKAPEYSFVPHHMLMQPELMARILVTLEITGLDGLVSALGDESRYQAESSFCSEYELYAQGLLNLSPASVALAKWSNRNVSREREIPVDKLGRYMSVSQHHYLT